MMNFDKRGRALALAVAFGLAWFAPPARAQAPLPCLPGVTCPTNPPPANDQVRRYEETDASVKYGPGWVQRNPSDWVAWSGGTVMESVVPGARATFTFWGGVFRFLLQLSISLLAFAQVLIVGIWGVIREIILMPFRLVRHFGSNVLAPGTPWIAVGMTFFWCVFEAIIFTFVMTSLVIDTLSNLAGTQLSETAIKVPLFLFMLFVALGSYAVLSTFTDALQTRELSAGEKADR